MPYAALYSRAKSQRDVVFRVTMVGLHTKWHYEQHSVDEINIALDRTQKKEDNLSIVFFGAVRRGLDRQSRSEDTLSAA